MLLYSICERPNGLRLRHLHRTAFSAVQVSTLWVPAGVSRQARQPIKWFRRASKSSASLLHILYWQRWGTQDQLVSIKSIETFLIFPSPVWV
jgi:hypothetical protein